MESIESLGFKVPNNETTGRPAFDSKDLLKLYIYGYFNGIRSSRKLAKQCKINREVILLIKDIKPKYRVISDFRKDNIYALEKLFNNFVSYCMDEIGQDEINLTDKDAKAVKFGANQGTDVGYNVQSVVEAKNKLITTFELNNLSQDQGQLYDMAVKAKEIYEVDEMVHRIETDKTKYARRKSIVEHPFGTIKRSMNFTY